MSKCMNVALIGCGTVGSAVACRLLEPKLGVAGQNVMELVAIVTKNPKYLDKLNIPPTLLRDSIEQVLCDPSIEVVVELVGGCDFAYHLVRQALLAGKHVVTANKALLAKYSSELFTLAIKQNCCLLFEASCGGGIPLISTIQQGLAANRIESFDGILNGTCNFILSQMDTGLSFNQALTTAQQQGIAEADPSLDLNGGDSAHKLALLASLAYQCQIDLQQIVVSPLSSELLEYLGHWRKLLTVNNLVMRLLIVARKQGEQLALHVAPSLVPSSNLLSQVGGAFNALRIKSDPLGESLYYGLGAGGEATSSAILADLLGLAQGLQQHLWRSRPRLPGLGDQAIIVSEQQLEHPHACFIKCRKDAILPLTTPMFRTTTKGDNLWQLLLWPSVSRGFVRQCCHGWQRDGLIEEFIALPYVEV